MAVAEDERTNEGQDQQQDGSGARTALIAAAAAAATGAATLAARKALSHDGNGNGGSRGRDDGDDGGSGSSSKKDPGSMLSTVASSAWESASEIVLPMADEAVAAAGRYLAESAPDIVRERLVPKFIEAFNEAS